MNSVVKIGLGIVALASIGVGGFFVLDHQVHSAIDNGLTGLSNTSPAITSVSYEGMHVDYIADTVTIDSVKLTFDGEELIKLQDIPETVTAQGTLVQDLSTVKMTGLWEMVFGAPRIPHLLVSQGAFRGDLEFSTPLPAKPDQNAGEKVLHQTVGMSGTFGETSIQGFSWQDSGQNGGQNGGQDGGQAPSSPYNPFGIVLDTITSQDFKARMSITANVPVKPNTDEPSGDLLDQELAVNFDMNVARLSGQGLSLRAIDALRYEDISFDVAVLSPQTLTVQASIDTFGLEDVVYVGTIPVKMTYFVEGFALPPEFINEPQIKGLMTAFGVNELNFDFKVSYDYNEKDSSLSVNPVSFAAKDAGKIDLAFDLTGVPDVAFFQQIEELNALRGASSAEALMINEKANQLMEQAMETLAFRQVSVSYEDFGVLKKFLALQAVKMKTDMAGVAERFSKQGTFLLMQTHGSDVAEDVRGKLAAFLEDPDALRVTVSSPKPIKIKDAMKDVEIFGLSALGQFTIDVQSGK